MKVSTFAVLRMSRWVPSTSTTATRTRSPSKWCSISSNISTSAPGEVGCGNRRIRGDPQHQPLLHRRLHRQSGPHAVPCATAEPVAGVPRGVAATASEMDRVILPARSRGAATSKEGMPRLAPGGARTRSGGSVVFHYSLCGDRRAATCWSMAQDPAHADDLAEMLSTLWYRAVYCRRLTEAIGRVAQQFQSRSGYRLVALASRATPPPAPPARCG